MDVLIFLRLMVSIGVIGLLIKTWSFLYKANTWFLQLFAEVSSPVE